MAEIFAKHRHFSSEPRHPCSTVSLLLTGNTRTTAGTTIINSLTEVRHGSQEASASERRGARTADRAECDREPRQQQPPAEQHEQSRQRGHGRQSVNVVSCPV